MTNEFSRAELDAAIAEVIDLKREAAEASSALSKVRAGHIKSLRVAKPVWTLIEIVHGGSEERANDIIRSLAALDLYREDWNARGRDLLDELEQAEE